MQPELRMRCLPHTDLHQEHLAGGWLQAQEQAEAERQGDEVRPHPDIVCVGGIQHPSGYLGSSAALQSEWDEPARGASGCSFPRTTKAASRAA